MKRIHPLVFLFVLLLAAAPGEGQDIVDLDLSLVTGYRVDNLSWSIAGDTSGQNPNILSELTWTDLRIYHLEVTTAVYIYNAALRASIGSGWIFEGQNRDSDYLGDNRTNEFSRSDNRSDSGSVLDLALGVGYRIRIAEGILDLTPLAGFAFHEQNLRMTDGYQTIPPLGAFEGLKSTYEAHWWSAWAGLELDLQLDWFRLFAAAEFHGVFYYHATADWNLRTDFEHPNSFEHLSSGHGINVSGGVGVTILETWSLYASVFYMKWAAGAGVDRTFLAGGLPAETRLNAVDWSSLGILFGMTFSL